ncbi:tail fiber assembly protein [Pseudomonas parakoreensis]|uniref:tail fiber assembly protein n=1 Tax=Pseudomonas parakoreensis TaxID=2892331 RepID=UPI00103F4640|nr:tail fiber assembly protein [Pseudomonas parakoreensis]
MNRYVLIEPVYQLNFKVVLQVVDAEDFPSLPGGPAYWIDVPQDTIVQAGWLAQFQTFQWVFAEPTYEDYVVLANARMSERFDAAIHWLTFNPLQYKKDIGAATSDDETALLAYKQYFVAVSEVKKQPGYPSVINWPVAPF